jgi:cytoskeletal protein RodZ
VFDRPENSPARRGDADDPTAVTPRAPGRDSTSIMPPVGGDASWGAAEAPWSGRAEVRPPRPGEYTSNDWATEPPSEPRGKWWMPIVIGIVGLLLLALLGWGIWLIARAQGNDDDTPAPVTTATAPAPTATRPTTPPTSAAPTTQQTTTEPTPSAVTIPALRGLSQDEARQALSRRGLSSRLRFLSSTDAPPGTVIDSDPAEGQEVPPDTVVTLVIAAEPRTSSSPSATATNQPGDD